MAKRDMTPERDSNITKTPEETARLQRQAERAARYLVRSNNMDVAEALGLDHLIPSGS